MRMLLNTARVVWLSWNSNDVIRQYRNIDNQRNLDEITYIIQSAQWVSMAKTS